MDKPKTVAELMVKIMLLKNEKRIAKADLVIADGRLKSVSDQLQSALEQLNEYDEIGTLCVRRESTY